MTQETALPIAASVDGDQTGFATVTVPAMQPGTGLLADILSRVTLNARATEPQDSWGWEVAGYLYLSGLGAGAFAVAVIMEWLGFRLDPAYVSPVSGWMWDWPKALLLWGPLVTVLGASLLIFHLGKNWLLFFTACRNLRTAWLARGFVILSGFIVVGVAVLVVSVFLPEWPGRLPILWRLVQALGLAFALGTAIYTGILLKSMKYIPAWNVPYLPFLFLASALSTGSMGVLLGATVYRFARTETSSTHAFIRAVEVSEPLILVAEAALLGLYLRHMMTGKPEGLLSAKMLLSGTWRYRFWIGIVGGALAVPFVLDSTNLGVGSDVMAITSAAAVLIAGFVLRLGVLAIGVKEKPPLYQLSMWRVARASSSVTAEAGRSQGRG